MNLTHTHCIVVALVIICATLLGVSHTLQSGDITNIYIACLGSLSGHAIGYAAAKSNNGNGS